MGILSGMLTDPHTATDGPRSFCVYTALIGRYENLNEQPVAASSGIPFICLTDDPELRSETWRVRPVTTLFGMDPIRSHRAIKLRPHEYLPDFDCSLYIDNSVLMTAPPERLIEQFLPNPGFCLAEHSYRNTLLDEFLEVAMAGFDDQGRIFEQLNHYTIDCEEVLQEKPYWCGLLLRDHRNPKVRAMLEIWSAHVQRYSRRDQLSINVAFRRAGLNPQVLSIDNYASRFHSWPHTAGRDRARGARTPASSLSPPSARIRELERQKETLERQKEALERQKETLERQKETLERQKEALERELAEERQRAVALLCSRSWRVTRPLRVVGRSVSRLLPSLQRSLKFVLRSPRSNRTPDATGKIKDA